MEWEGTKRWGEMPKSKAEANLVAAKCGVVAGGSFVYPPSTRVPQVSLNLFTDNNRLLTASVVGNK